MTQTKIILAGGGGHALSVLEAAEEKDFAGYLALEPSEIMPLKWLGDDNDVASLAKEGYTFHLGYVYSGLPIMNHRRKMLERYEEAGAKFATIIAPTATVTRNSHIGDGCAILNNAVINRATIGGNTVVNTGAIVEHDCMVGENTFIGPGAIIGGAVKIGRDCFIGLGACIKNCVTIGDCVTVAMGAVVNKDLTEPGIYHGNPLKRFPLPKTDKL